MASKEYSLLDKKGMEIAMQYIIPIILGILVIVFFIVMFGPGKMIGMLNKTFNFSTTP